MNYYPHHIGDYSRDTAHLSMLEDAAYRRMLDLYYAAEKPLPMNRQGIYRLVRAHSKDEQNAVDVILGEFFTETKKGWRNARAEAEIAKAQAEGASNKERRESEKVRQQRHRDRRKNLFAGLREHGVTPPWDATTEELQAALEKCTSQSSHEPVTRDVTATPLANNQKPLTKTNNQTNKDEVALRLPEWLPLEAWKGWLEVRKSKKVPNTPRALSVTLEELTRLRSLGFDPAKVLDQSTVKGWKTVHPLRVDLMAVAVEPKGKLCDYCAKVSSGQVNGRRACETHWTLAMDNTTPLKAVA